MKKWIEAARLRTLPLSLAGIFCGFALSHNKDGYILFILCVLTAVCLQVLSNFANDYGDFTKGTDNDNRVGPARTMQKGLITKLEMKRVLILFSILSFGLGMLTSILAFNLSLITLFFILLGGACVLAAITYTIGKRAYGYSGLGDIFVFVFFGLVSVLGTKYVVLQSLELLDLLPAISIGLFSSAVLNLNNMRDIENDAAQNKNTLVTKMGLNKAMIYQYTLITIGILTIGTYAILTKTNSIFSFTSYLIFPVFVLHIIRLNKKGVHTNFDPELKKIAIPTFLLSILFIIQEFIK